MRTLDGRKLSSGEVLARLNRDPADMERALNVAREIVAQVRSDGDSALMRYAEKLDGIRPTRLVLDRSYLEEVVQRIPRELRDALELAADQIRAFHAPQLPSGYEVTIGPGGSRAGQLVRPLVRIGAYVPGGLRGYPSSVLMDVIPARLAGVREILVATPPSRNTGLPPNAVLAAAAIAGADEVLVSGGAQAVAAMAYGTPSVQPVDRIVGPGNLYVTAAKLVVQNQVSTDGIAGPSEVLVIGDGSLSTEMLAAELIAQAEHDEEAVAIGLLTDERSFDQVLEEITRQSKALPRGQTVRAALERNGWLLRVSSTTQAIEIANEVAPEHLVLAVQGPEKLLPSVRNSGCVFLGPLTTAAFGDYSAGTNHVLPTARSSRWRGALSVRDFVKFITYLQVAPADVSTLGEAAATIAEAEGFTAHKAALRARTKSVSAMMK